MPKPKPAHPPMRTRNREMQSLACAKEGRAVRFVMMRGDKILCIDVQPQWAEDFMEQIAEVLEECREEELNAEA